MPNEKTKISFKERLAYSFGDLASNLANATVSWFAVYYYTNIVHVSSGIVGTIMMVVLFADSVFEVVMGLLVDRTRSRMGKARPWLLRMCIPIAALFVLTFSVPHLGVGKTVYVCVTFLLYNFSYSAINVPYGILNSLITQDQYERSILNIFRMIMAYGTTIFVGIATLPVVQLLGGTELAWTLTAVLYAVCMIVLFLLTFRYTKERTVQNIQEKAAVPIRTGLRALFQNTYWRVLMIFALILYVFVSVNSGVTVYYTGYFLNNSSLVGTMTITFYIPIVVGLFFLSPFIVRYGKRNMTVFGIVVSFVGVLLPLFAPTNIAVVLAGNLIKGFGMMPVFGSLYAMIADTIEYGEWKTGVRTEGLVYSASSFGIKAGTGLGSAVLGWGLALGGYVGSMAKQPSSAGVAIEFLYSVLPLLIFLVLILILCFYRLDREYEGVVRELAQRRSMPQAAAPEKR